ncbi:MAG: hypothetical protein ACXWKO_16485 [Phenylobacterium sp.]
MLAPAIAEPAATRRGTALPLDLGLLPRLGLALRAIRVRIALLRLLSRLMLVQRLALRLRLSLRLVLGLRLRLALGLGLTLLLLLPLLLLRLAGGLIALPLLLVRLFLLAAFAARIPLFSPGDCARQSRSRQDGGEKGPVHFGRRPLCKRAVTLVQPTLGARLGSVPIRFNLRAHRSPKPDSRTWRGGLRDGGCVPGWSHVRSGVE